MNLIKKITSYPARWRRSRGFGVHSPFAYNFITKVLREKDAAYYAYAEIAAFCPRARRAGFNEIFAGKDMSVPEAQMLFRVLCYFNPSEIIEIGHGHEVTNIIINRSVPKAVVKTWHATRDMKVPNGCEPVVLLNQIIPDECGEAVEMIENLRANGGVVLIVRHINILPNNRDVWREITENATSGMSFTDGYMGIYVGRDSLPRQEYDIIL